MAWVYHARERLHHRGGFSFIAAWVTMKPWGMRQEMSDTGLRRRATPTLNAAGADHGPRQKGIQRSE